MRPRSIVLIGLRCVGKSTIGRALADRLGWSLADSDDLLAAAVGRPAGQWLAEVGEAEFRRREEVVLLPLLATARDAVIATGGGAITIAAVRHALAVPGVFPVWLVAATEVLLGRATASGIVRPALTALEPSAEWEETRRQREPLYAAVARLSVDTAVTAPAGCVDAIVSAWRRHELSGS